MKVFKLMLAAMFMCASINVFADEENALSHVKKVTPLPSGKGKVTAIQNISKDNDKRLLQSVK